MPTCRSSSDSLPFVWLTTEITKAASQRFQVLDERALLLGRQVGAVRVPGVAVAGRRGVEPRPGPFGVGAGGHEPDAHRLVDVVAAPEQRGATIGFLEEIGQ